MARRKQRSRGVQGEGRFPEHGSFMVKVGKKLGSVAWEGLGVMDGVLQTVFSPNIRVVVSAFQSHR